MTKDQFLMLFLNAGTGKRMFHMDAEKSMKRHHGKDSDSAQARRL